MINRLSSADEVFDCVEKFNGKAVHWYNKCCPDEKELHIAANDRCINTKNPQHTRTVIYQPKNENEWLVTQCCYYNAACIVTWRDICNPIYRDQEGIGAFWLLKDVDGEECTLHLTPHFYQRFSERYLIPHNINAEGIDVLVEFCKLNHFAVSKISQYKVRPDGSSHLWIALPCGVAAVTKVSTNGMYEARTFLTEDMLFHDQLEESKFVRDELQEQIAYCRNMAIQATTEYYVESVSGNKSLSKSDLSCAKRLLDSSDNDEIKSMAAWIDGIHYLIKVVCETDMPIGQIWLDRRLRPKKRIIDLFRNIIAEKDPIAHPERIKLFLVSVLQSLELDFDNTALDDFLNHAKNIYNEQQLNQQSVMNNTQRTALERILRDIKFKGFSSVASSVTKAKNGDVYMSTVEPIFAVSRIIPKINAQSDIPKILEVQRLWMEQVINNGWCPQLFPYEQKYGKVLLLKSILYMIDNGLWDSPTGSDFISSKDSAKYDRCFSAIDETAQFLISEHPELAVSEASITNTSQSPDPSQPQCAAASAMSSSAIVFCGSPAEHPSDPSQVSSLPINTAALPTKEQLVSAITDSDAAGQMTSVVTGTLKASLDMLEALKQYLANNVSQLEQSDTQNLLRQLADKDTKIHQIEEQRDKWKKNQEESQANYVKKSTECTDLKNQVLTLLEEKEELQKKISLLEVSLNSATADIADKAKRITELEAKSAMPRKRICPLTRITQMPLVGEKMKVQIVKLLEELDVEVNQHK